MATRQIESISSFLLIDYVFCPLLIRVTINQSFHLNVSVCKRSLELLPVATTPSRKSGKPSVNYSPVPTDQSSIIKPVDKVRQATRRTPVGPNLSIHLLSVCKVLASGCPRETRDTRRSSQPDSSGQPGSIQSPTEHGCVRTHVQFTETLQMTEVSGLQGQITPAFLTFHSGLYSACFFIFPKPSLSMTGNKNRVFRPDSSLAINHTFMYEECDGR